MRINLNGKWNLSSKNLEQELVVNVPGSIMTDLYEYKLIDDPYYRDNEYKTLEIFNYDYTYQRDFYLDEEIQGKEMLPIKQEKMFSGLFEIKEIFLEIKDIKTIS